MKTQAKGPITRDSLLGTIEFQLEMVDQWSRRQAWNWAAHYHARAEMLIELLEVSDCGSSGGFADGQLDRNRRDLHDRFEWLKQSRGELR